MTNMNRPGELQDTAKKGWHSWTHSKFISNRHSCGGQILPFSSSCDFTDATLVHLKDRTKERRTGSQCPTLVIQGKPKGQSTISQC